MNKQANYNSENFSRSPSLQHFALLAANKQVAV